MTEKKDLKQLIDELEEAKNNVLACLKNANVSVNFHGLTYWAERVEKLREEIKEAL